MIFSIRRVDDRPLTSYPRLLPALLPAQPGKRRAIVVVDTMEQLAALSDLVDNDFRSQSFIVDFEDQCITIYDDYLE